MLWIIASLGIFACSSSELSAPKWSEEAVAHWFEGNDTFSMKDYQGELLAHGFFDLTSNIDKDANTLHFVLLTPEKSKELYELELTSGRKYRRAFYCERKDIWGKYNRKLNTPPYSEGYVPGVLDELGRPQEVIVFGDLEYFEPLSLRPQTAPFSQLVRIVGGLVQDHCSNYPCEGEWPSKTILVGVNPKDPKFSDVKDFKSLQELIEWKWDLTLAFLNNGKGEHTTIHGGKPAYRLRTHRLSAKQALSQVLQKGHIFTHDELSSLKQNCTKLYDYVWNNVVEIHDQVQVEQKLYDEWQQQAKKLKQSWDVVRKEKLKTLKQKKYGSRFNKFFSDFYQKYGTRFITCSHYVRPGSISQKRERFWFFGQMSLFYQLEALDYVYLCSKGQWVKNHPKTSGEGNIYNQAKLLKECSNSDLDKALSEAVGLQMSEQALHRAHYFFLEYDLGLAGSHEKIYNWVYDSGLQFRCESEREKDKSASDFARAIYPQNIPWMKFSTPFEQKKFIK